MINKQTENSLHTIDGESIDAAADAALVEIGRWLKHSGYRFVTVTPATHERSNERWCGTQTSVEDIFGWSRPFRASALPADVLTLLQRGRALRPSGDLLLSRVRYSTLDAHLYMHSAYPTTASDAVFFGPDTYRFAAFIKATFARWPALATGCIVDVGCGTGAGGVVAYESATAPKQLILTDINTTALRYASINCRINDIQATFREADLFDGMDGPIDVIVANPPYLVDPENRLYRHGGGTHGAELSLRIVREGIAALSPGGALLLYTGSCIVRGNDLMRDAIQAATRDARFEVTYAELDPDVFGEELSLAGYDDVDRIAVVGAVVRCINPAVTRSHADAAFAISA
jgi:methylase of polypeptide subunit release factors